MFKPILKDPKLPHQIVLAFSSAQETKNMIQVSCNCRKGNGPIKIVDPLDGLSPVWVAYDDPKAHRGLVPFVPGSR